LIVSISSNLSVVAVSSTYHSDFSHQSIYFTIEIESVKDVNICIFSYSDTP